VFTWYAREKLVRKRFNRVQVAAGTRDALARLDRTDLPAVVLLSHSSWWDPLVALLLAAELAPSRSIAAPMDRRELERFGFFRKVGVFGVDPDDPSALEPMVAYVMQRFEREKRGTLWITPQGRFADARAPVRCRPGAAAVAARAVETFGGVEVVSAAIEYGFWEDQKPEIFLRFAPVSTEGVGTASWHRAITRGMQANAAALAELVIARDAAAFEPLLAAKPPRVHPLYDWYLRLTGRQRALGAERQKGVAL